MTTSEDRILETQLYYILNENKIPIPASAIEWGEFRANSPFRWVKQERISPYFISTAFVGIDHGFPPYPGYVDLLYPILFETMVFKGDDMQEIYVDRYSAWDEAEKGHTRAVEWVANRMKENDR